MLYQVLCLSVGILVDECPVRILVLMYTTIEIRFRY